MITVLLHGNDLPASPLRVRPCLNEKYIKPPHVSINKSILIEGDVRHGVPR